MTQPERVPPPLSAPQGVPQWLREAELLGVRTERDAPDRAALHAPQHDALKAAQGQGTFSSGVFVWRQLDDSRAWIPALLVCPDPANANTWRGLFAVPQAAQPRVDEYDFRLSAFYLMPPALLSPFDSVPPQTWTPAQAAHVQALEAEVKILARFQAAQVQQRSMLSVMSWEDAAQRRMRLVAELRALSSEELKAVLMDVQH